VAQSSQYEVTAVATAGTTISIPGFLSFPEIKVAGIIKTVTKRQITIFIFLDTRSP